MKLMDIRAYFENRYAEHPGYGKQGFLKMDILIKMVGFGNTVLDFGSFEGTIAKRIQDAGNRVFAADAVFSALCLAKKKIGTVIQIPFSPPYPFKDKIFDVVFIAEVIEHILDTDGFLLEVKRIVKDDGFIIITTPNVASLGRRIMLLCGINPYLEFSLSTKMSNPGIGHIRYFTKNTLFELLGANGFEILEFKSDVVSLSRKGFYSRRLARFFPTLGRSLMVKCKKI